MTGPDDQPVDQPVEAPLDVDLAAVAADDALLEALLAGDLDDTDDAALAALGALLDDVSTDLPAAVPVTAPLAPVVPLRRRRTATRVALAAVVGAGVLSVGGVAAAQPGSALRPLRDVVTEVVSGAASVVAGVTGRDAQDGPRAAASPTPSPTATPPATRSATPSPSATGQASATAPSTPGTAGPASSSSSASASSTPSPRSTVAAQNRSRSAAVQADGALDRAEALLDDGRTRGVPAQLDTAERLLRDVLPGAQRTALQRRLDGLRVRYQRAVAAEQSPRATTGSSRGAGPQRATAEPARSASSRGRATPGPRAGSGAQATAEPARAPREPRATRAPRAAGDRAVRTSGPTRPDVTSGDATTSADGPAARGRS